MNSNYSDRIFQSTDEIITGRSVVKESMQKSTEHNGLLPLKNWPYTLSDYLQNFIGNSIQVKYTIHNGRHGEKQGDLIVVGSDFIGIRPLKTEDLFIIELSQISCVNVIKYEKRFSGNAVG